MYETLKQRPLSRADFARRLATHVGAAAALVLASLAVGMAGYMAFEHLRPLDAFLNAAMLLGGMGPVDSLKTSAGKLFAGLYALYAGLVFILSATMVVTPVAHRLLHKLHWDSKL